ncbi:Holliday junction branch migration protein RuvA [Candidatus Shapirobacteria bacterium]|nr:Holliday junction branch migration protein RuvA [Candidatus Shapirobacteria bacterium]
MISSLKGKIGRVWQGGMEIEVGGVGYEVQLQNTNYELRIGDEIKLYIYMAVSENDIRLFGFKTVEELDLFKLLITVSGVGPRTAAGILGEKQSLEIMKAIGEADVDFFKKIKGIGLKTAQRIIVDLKSKINKQELDMTAFAESFGESKEDDVVLSLKQLGFEKKEIESVLKKMPKELTEIEEKISWCLQNLGR